MELDYNERLETIEILKIHHDQKIDDILAKYPAEKGYEVNVVELVSLDAKTEKITFSIKERKKAKEDNLSL